MKSVNSYDRPLSEQEREYALQQNLREQKDLDDCMDSVAAQFEEKQPGGNGDMEDFYDAVEDCMIDKGWPPPMRP